MHTAQALHFVQIQARKPIDNRPQVTNLSSWAYGPQKVMKTLVACDDGEWPELTRSLGQWISRSRQPV